MRHEGISNKNKSLSTGSVAKPNDNCALMVCNKETRVATVGLFKNLLTTTSFNNVHRLNRQLIAKLFVLYNISMQKVCWNLWPSAEQKLKNFDHLFGLRAKPLL